MRQSIAHIALVVKDYDEAIDFYTRKLHFSIPISPREYGRQWPSAVSYV